MIFYYSGQPVTIPCLLAVVVGRVMKALHHLDTRITTHTVLLIIKCIQNCLEGQTDKYPCLNDN